MPPTIPTDRIMALACSLRTLRHLWLHVECCGSRTLPLRAETRPGTLADLVMALRATAATGRAGGQPGRVGWGDLQREGVAAVRVGEAEPALAPEYITVVEGRKLGPHE